MNTIELLMDEVARLKEQVRYWQDAYRQAQEEVEKLSLDLGLRERTDFKKGESDA